MRRRIQSALMPDPEPDELMGFARKFSRDRMTAGEKRELSERRQVARLAGQIKDQAQLDKVLDATAPDMRAGVLEQLRPHLRFTPTDERN